MERESSAVIKSICCHLMAKVRNTVKKRGAVSLISYSFVLRKKGSQVGVTLTISPLHFASVSIKL